MVIVGGEGGDVVVEGVDAGGGQVAGLAHAATHELAGAAGAADELAAANQDGTDRGAEALGETDRDGVEKWTDGCWGISGFDQGIENAGAVKVEAEAQIATGG